MRLTEIELYSAARLIRAPTGNLNTIRPRPAWKSVARKGQRRRYTIQVDPRWTARLLEQLLIAQKDVHLLLNDHDLNLPHLLFKLLSMAPKLPRRHIPLGQLLLPGVDMLRLLVRIMDLVA